MSTDNVQRESNVSPRKQKMVEGASFDTIIAALGNKSVSAQGTFFIRLLDAILPNIPGETLALGYKRVEKEIKRRATSAAAGVSI